MSGQGQNPVVELWDLQIHLTLIVHAPTGVFYSNQTGGTACAQPRLEGYAIPLNTYFLPDPDPFLDRWPGASKDEITKWLEADELIAHFEALDPKSEEAIAAGIAEPGEAWVPVRVREHKSELGEGLSSFLYGHGGKLGVLTYKNSD